MIIVTSTFFLPKNIRGLTLFPFIFIGSKADLKNKVLINHEKIHIRQQLELLILPFYIRYLADFLIQYRKYKNYHLAYRNIIFEKEAYANEKSSNYLKTRRFCNFLKY